MKKLLLIIGFGSGLLSCSNSTNKTISPSTKISTDSLGEKIIFGDIENMYDGVSHDIFLKDKSKYVDDFSSYFSDASMISIGNFSIGKSKIDEILKIYPFKTIKSNLLCKSVSVYYLDSLKIGDIRIGNIFLYFDDSVLVAFVSCGVRYESEDYLYSYNIYNLSEAIELKYNIDVSYFEHGKYSGVYDVEAKKYLGNYYIHRAETSWRENCIILLDKKRCIKLAKQEIILEEEKNKHEISDEKNKLLNSGF